MIAVTCAHHQKFRTLIELLQIRQVLEADKLMIAVASRLLSRQCRAFYMAEPVTLHNYFVMQEKHDSLLLVII